MYRKGVLYFIGKTVKNVESVGKEKQEKAALISNAAFSDIVFVLL